jgi:hypothetical protein
MASKDSKGVVLEYLNAFANKDFQAIRSIVHDDLSFRGPVRQFQGGDQFVEALSKMGPLLKSIDVKKIFADGEDVSVIYDFVTTNPAIGTTPTAEWIKVKDGKIQSTLLIFDARPYV